MMIRIAAALVLLSATAQAARQDAPGTTIVRTSGVITIDGELSDPGWAGAAIIDRFYETSPGDNTEPTVKTRALLAYDEKYLYIAVRSDDPEPHRIRAPFVERDNVLTESTAAQFRAGPTATSVIWRRSEA